MSIHVPEEACGTKSELLKEAKKNLHEFQHSLIDHGFILSDSYYVLPQGPSCWDPTISRWKPSKLEKSPLRFVATLDDVPYVIILNYIATDDIIVNVWTLNETTTHDGTLRKVQNFGYHLGTYVLFLFEGWEEHFYQWFHVFHDEIKAFAVPSEVGRCSMCRKITSIREVGAICGVNSVVCKDCVDKYHYKM